MNEPCGDILYVRAVTQKQGSTSVAQGVELAVRQVMALLAE